MSEVILKTQQLFGGYHPQINILNGIDISISSGEILGVIGLNGSGKSTFGRALVNLLPYRSGQVIFKGNDISNFFTNELSANGLKIMMQGGRVFLNLSIWQNLELAAQKQLTTFISSYSDMIPLLQKSLKDLKSITADKLSGGQRHQLALAMTLASKPSCIILDEPSAGLSPTSVNNMYTILRDIHDITGITIVLIEQNIAKAIEFAHRSILINQGKIVKEITNGNIAEVEYEMFNF